MASVLILENSEDKLTLYERYLTSEGYSTRGATTLDSALDAVDSTRFDLCIADLMLDDPRSHDSYDGAHLVAAINHLNEGTECVILSGQGRPSVAADIVKTFEVFEYVDKKDLIDGGSQVLASVAARALAASSRETLRDPLRVGFQMYGARGVDSAIAETNLVRFLNPYGGPSALRSAFTVTLETIFPLFPREPTTSGWHERGSVATRRYWSKALGAPVVVNISYEPIDSPIEPVLAAQAARLHFMVSESDQVEGRHMYSGCLPGALRNPLAK